MAGFLLPGLGVEIHAWIGWILVAVAVWTVAGLLFPLLRLGKALLGHEPLKGRYGLGSWVVVTGASTPLGSEFCSVFAASGYNLALISRHETDLHTLSSSLQAKFAIQTRVLPCDFSVRSENLEDFYKRFCRQMEDLDVSVVVNLLNMTETGLFAEEAYGNIAKAVDLNIWPATIFARWALVRMSKRNSRSAIINLSSLVALYPYAGMTLTSASMKFADFLLVSLANEAKTDANLSQKVDFLSFRPSGIQSQAETGSRTSVKEVVSGVIRNLGASPYTAGAWKHSLLTAFLSLFPETLKESAMVNQFRKQSNRKAKSQ